MVQGLPTTYSSKIHEIFSLHSKNPTLAGLVRMALCQCWKIHVNVAIAPSFPHMKFGQFLSTLL